MLECYEDYSGNFLELTPENLDELAIISENSTVAGYIAKSILSMNEEPQMRKSRILNDHSLDFNLYPNPAYDHFAIEWNNENCNPYKLVMTDISGKIFMEIPISEGISNFQIYTGSLTKGMYIVGLFEKSGMKKFKRMIVIK